MSLIGEYLSTLSGGGGIVVLSNASVSDYNSGFASASYTLTSTGDVFATDTINGSLDIGDWISPKSGAPGSYEVRADVVFGTVTGSATGSWLALTTSRTWTLQLLEPGFDAAQLTVSIRLGGTTLTTATIDLTVYVEFDYGGGGEIP